MCAIYSDFLFNYPRLLPRDDSLIAVGAAVQLRQVKPLRVFRIINIAKERRVVLEASVSILVVVSPGGV